MQLHVSRFRLPSSWIQGKKQRRRTQQLSEATVRRQESLKIIFFYCFPFGFCGRKRRQEGKGEEETSPAGGRREGSGSVSCESNLGSICPYPFYGFHCTCDGSLATSAGDLRKARREPWSRQCPALGLSLLSGAGGLGAPASTSSQLPGQESCSRGTGIPITQQPAQELCWVLPEQSPPHSTAKVVPGMGAPWRHDTFGEALSSLTFRAFCSSQSGTGKACSSGETCRVTPDWEKPLSPGPCSGQGVGNRIKAVKARR